MVDDASPRNNVVSGIVDPLRHKKSGIEWRNIDKN
jgi:hypothetical protein